MKRLASFGFVAAIGLALTAGCYAPVCSRGTPASELPEIYRMPERSVATPLNFSHLTVSPPVDYILGPNDTLNVLVIEGGEEARAAAQPQPLPVQVLGDGRIHLPLVGGVQVGGLTLSQAQKAVYDAYVPEYYKNPAVSVALVQKSTVNVVVLGAVAQPGVYPLPKYENDVGHALAIAGGLTPEAGKVIEVHRRSQFHGMPGIPAPMPGPPLPAGPPLPGHDPDFEPRDDGTPMDEVWRLDLPPDQFQGPNQSRNPGASLKQSIEPLSYSDDAARTPDEIFGWTPLAAASPGRITLAQHEQGYYTPPVPETIDGILRIPLRGAAPGQLGLHEVVLQPGDVVVVPNKKHDVFYVVGPVAPLNFIRFTVGMEEREIGGGFLIPPNRDIDVVTAVAMAGYIDPIDSPTTVTVHRMQPDGEQLLITVDLIKARYSWKENMYIQPGDIIYLNPDPWWWLRRTFDRVLPNLITIPYQFRIVGPGHFRNN